MLHCHKHSHTTVFPIYQTNIIITIVFPRGLSNTGAKNADFNHKFKLQRVKQAFKTPNI